MSWVVAWMLGTRSSRRAEIAAAASLLSTVAAVVHLLLGPVDATRAESCSSAGPCVMYSGAESLPWNGVLLVPLVAAGLVLAGAVLNRRTALSLPTAGIGCLGLAVVTLLGVISIGVFLVPADVAAAVALLCMRQRRAA